MTWLGDIFRRYSPPPPIDPIARGDAVIAEALRLWRLGIYDPPIGHHSADDDRCRAAISAMISGPLGLGWSWEGEYRGDGAFAWCGALAARCWSVAGISLGDRRDYFSSTWRLDQWAHYRPVRGEHVRPRPSVGYRMVAALDKHSVTLPFAPQAGDILLVGPTLLGNGRLALDYGHHVTLVERYDAEARVFYCVAGNGGGIAPGGKRWEGVVRCQFPLGSPSQTAYYARRLIRPGLADLA